MPDMVRCPLFVVLILCEEEEECKGAVVSVAVLSSASRERDQRDWLETDEEARGTAPEIKRSVRTTLINTRK
jgi:hypothetical protein